MCSFHVMDNYGSGRPSVMKTTRMLLDEDGWRGFYRGFGPRFLNMSLWGTSMIVTYELISMSCFKNHLYILLATLPSLLTPFISFKYAERLSVKPE
jgi:hypothetical protein